MSTTAERQRREAAVGASEPERTLAAVDVVAWEYVNRHWDLFGSSTQYLDEIYRVLTEESLDDVALSTAVGGAEWEFAADLFADAFTAAIERLKAEGRFAPPRFETDVLLGVFFSDPGPYDLHTVEGVSRRVNSAAWQAAVQRYASYARP